MVVIKLFMIFFLVFLLSIGNYYIFLIRSIKLLKRANFYNKFKELKDYKYIFIPYWFNNEKIKSMLDKLDE